MQTNFITNVRYSGSNQDSLLHAKMAKGYATNEWLTFVQARKAGRKVKKGEKGIRLVRIIEFKNKKGVKETRAVGFTVFNISQTELV